jgi:hypothetical protein
MQNINLLIVGCGRGIIIMLRVIANDLNQRGLRHVIAEIERREAEIRRVEDGARIRFSDGRVVSLTKEPHISESSFMAAVQQWAQRHGAGSLKVEHE